MSNFRFIDLFAGIGGMRIPFEKLGGECVFSSEWDEHAQRTYYHNFGEMPKGDITKIDERIFRITTFYLQVFRVSHLAL